jgi:hypothetical protein
MNVLTFYILQIQLFKKLFYRVSRIHLILDQEERSEGMTENHGRRPTQNLLPLLIRSAQSDSDLPFSKWPRRMSGFESTQKSIVAIRNTFDPRRLPACRLPKKRFSG